MRYEKVMSLFSVPLRVHPGLCSNSITLGPVHQRGFFCFTLVKVIDGVEVFSKNPYMLCPVSQQSP